MNGSLSVIGAQLNPASDDFHKPPVREPTQIMLESFGVILMKSIRPFALEIFAGPNDVQFAAIELVWIDWALVIHEISKNINLIIVFFMIRRKNGWRE